jgi:hypothetical protein
VNWRVLAQAPSANAINTATRDESAPYETCTSVAITVWPVTSSRDNQHR